MKKLFAILSIITLINCFVGCKGGLSENDKPPNSTMSSSDTTKDNLGDDIEW